MALRDQPYLPLYIQDIMTDEKLNECSPSTHGIYIKGLMCLMHKSKTYGKILLKQKYKQNKSMSLNFANQLVKHLPYTTEEIKNAIDELIEEEVCYFEDEYICQKRMIKDNQVSEARSKAGKKGGGNPNFVKTKKQTKQQTNTQTNSEYEYEYEDEDSLKGGVGEKFSETEKSIAEYFGYDEINHFEQIKQINYFVTQLHHKKLLKHFKEQFEFYKKYKELIGGIIHSFRNFIGYKDSGDFHAEKGAWNYEDWELKYKNYNKNGNNVQRNLQKRERIIDAPENANYDKKL